MRRRIVVFAAATAALAVLLLAIPLGIVAAHGFVRDERLELQQTAATVAARVSGDVVSSRHPLTIGGEILVSVYDAHGHRVSGAGAPGAGSLVPAALSGRSATTTGDQTITTAAPVSDGDQVVAAVVLTTSLDAAHARTRAAWWALAGMSLAAVALAAAGAALLARRLTRPLDRLTAVAARVADGDLSARSRPSRIAEIDTLAAALDSGMDRVQELLARERAFSAEVSHQLRTPLAALRLELEATDRRGDLSGSLRAVDRMEATIGEVVRLARDLSSTDEVDVRSLLATVADRWRGPLAAQARPLHIDAEPDAPDSLALSADAAAQILDVLVDNAYRHGRGAVTVRTRTDRASVAVEVADEGGPLTVESWRLFAHGPRDRSGHGIGLPYARRLAEAEQARLVLRTPVPPTFALITKRIVRA